MRTFERLRAHSAAARGTQVRDTYGIYLAGSRRGAGGALHESLAHMHYIWLKSAVSSDRPLPFANRLELCLQTSRRHSVGYGECRREVCTHISQRLANCRDRSHAPTAVRGTADGTRRSTGDTLNMGASAGTGEALA